VFHLLFPGRHSWVHEIGLLCRVNGASDSNIISF